MNSKPAPWNEAPDLPSELDRLKWAVNEGHSNALGQFFEWLEQEKGFIMSVENEHGDIVPAHVNVDQLLHEYFGIDQAKVEAERQQILAEIRGRRMSGIEHILGACGMLTGEDRKNLITALGGIVPDDGFLHVLCLNDYPDSVWESEEEALREKARLSRPDRGIYFHVNSVPINKVSEFGKSIVDKKDHQYGNG